MPRGLNPAVSSATPADYDEAGGQDMEFSNPYYTEVEDEAGEEVEEYYDKQAPHQCM